MAKLNPDVFLLAAEELLANEVPITFNHKKYGCCGHISFALSKLEAKQYMAGMYSTPYHSFFHALFEDAGHWDESYCENWGSITCGYPEREARVMALLICWIEAKKCRK